VISLQKQKKHELCQCNADIIPHDALCADRLNQTVLDDQLVSTMVLKTVMDIPIHMHVSMYGITGGGGICVPDQV
jgi:hypothetical protein